MALDHRRDEQIKDRMACRMGGGAGTGDRRIKSEDRADGMFKGMDCREVSIQRLVVGLGL